MIKKIAKFIERHKLLPQKATVLVALSGGADSVALLLVLQRLGYKCCALHCNFHLRNEESTRDEQFVRELCEKLDITLTIVNFDTAKYADAHNISIEMAAREQRYAAFEEERRKQHACAIAVAHHRNDSAETVLLNLIRGTGIKGLHGIRPKNGYIVRPLLDVGRDDILHFLKNEHQNFVTDSTNLKTDFTRNKIRLQLLPLMQEINPSAIESIAATAERIAEAEEIYNNAVTEAVARVKKGNSIIIKALMREKAPRTILHEILSPLGFNSAQTRDIFASADGDSGRRFTSEEYIVVKDREALIIEKRERIVHESIELPLSGIVETANGNLLVECVNFNGEIPRSRNIACLDADNLHLPLTLRRTCKGDRFAPFGMRGTKSVSDYLTDRKRTIIEKERQLVITDATGNIVWLVDERPAASCCCTKETKKILRLTWHRIEEP